MTKNAITVIILLTFFFRINAQENHDKYADYSRTINSTIDALYMVISGEKGEARDWELMRYLYHPNAMLVATGKNRQGKVGATYVTPQSYVENSGKWLVENGFFEEEIHRKVEVFGNIAQVFSTYQCFKSKSDTTPFMRGINGIQLLNEGNRWRIINIFWTQETEENPIPEAYLPKL
ncbi:hypothetical protein ATE84_3490 [Aquimarina sp. MAR_2010_214]|uniref:hypothetical protein n=1 Tax=Aquimarina sp. MAR_2010_214 TaxID=1250026 RepID=UPI000C707D41|nr:hypothetical protein [Aquimarina sp. MAR_2010_214]PKV51405.1 hypothetical protein ATE84_3490 [Aquimarina sp. MAR_2010_214]